MKNRRACADQRRGEQDRAKRASHRQYDQADDRKSHAGRQRIRHRPAICVKPYQRLQKRCRTLIGERNDTDFKEIEVVGLLK